MCYDAYKLMNLVYEKLVERSGHMQLEIDKSSLVVYEALASEVRIKIIQSLPKTK